MKKRSFYPIVAIPVSLLWRNVMLFIFICSIFSALLSCEQDRKLNTDTKNKFTQDFVLIDSLTRVRELARTISILDSIRPAIQQTDILNLSNYYYYSGMANSNIEKVSFYGDSLMYLYEDVNNQTLYPSGYLKALSYKANLYIRTRNYDNALIYLFKIKPHLSTSIDRLIYLNYLTKIAHIHYIQKKYRIAGSYYKQAYELLSKPGNLSELSIFQQKQVILNNAGFSYESAELLDSAEIFYRQGLSYLEKEAAIGVIDKSEINICKIVYLDNLGGLLAKKGDYIGAEKLLEESVAINGGLLTDDKGTAYLKLAETYGKLGKIAKADIAYDIAKQLIYAKIGNQLDIKTRYQKSISEYLLSQQNYQQAYVHLSTYNQLKDSLDQLKNANSQIDLKLKFENLQSKEDVNSLEKTNKGKTAYLVAIALSLLMLIPIILLVLKNTRGAKRAENATQKHNLALEKTMKRLEHRNNDYAKMMKVMAHDLKNPIGGMVGVANLLLEDKRFAKEDKELLHLIETSGENAIEMINQLLNSGLAIENEVLKKEPVDLQHLLRQCTELLQYKADEKQQKIILISAGPLMISLSKEKIWRVLNNLIVNAIKFSPENADIKVVLEHLEKSAKVSIIDQGIGVPQKDKEKIFEMFTAAKRLGTAGEQPFGIGLSISKQIIESHDGKIWLEENPLGGTIFYVEIPFPKKSMAIEQF